MASRFNQQRDTARSSLFSGYDQRSTNASNPQRSRPTSTSTSPNPYTASYGYNDPGSSNNNNNTFSAYPSHNTNTGASQNFRTATPDRRGNMYSDSVLSELESQNDDQVSEMSKKVGMLKDVSDNSPFFFFFFFLSFLISISNSS
jgi:blocked-early-in-transport protein 1